MELKPFLEDIERRINPEEEERLEREWLTFADGKCTDPFFSPKREVSRPSLDYPVMLINDAFGREDWMVYQQLKLVSEELESGKGNLLNVRANYGTGIIPSMFGAEVYYMDAKLDTLPCTKTLTDGEDGVRRILSERRVDYSRGLAGNVFRFAQVYAEAVKDYPKIRRYVHVYNPDLQGPFPLADELWGGDIYYAMYEDEELLHDMLGFMTDTYIAFTKKWQALYPSFDETHSVEWGLLHRGKTIVRNDAVMNISGDMYEEFVKPYDQRILSELTGGIHFCGRGDHYIEHVGALDRISCVNMSQPHLNKMDVVYANTIERGIPIIGMPEAEVIRAREAGVNLRGLVHSGASLAVWETKK